MKCSANNGFQFLCRLMILFLCLAGFCGCTTSHQILEFESKVKTIDDALAASAKAVSKAAKRIGIKKGQSINEVLKIIS